MSKFGWTTEGAIQSFDGKNRIITQRFNRSFKLHLERHSKVCSCSICQLNKVGFIIPKAWNAFNAWYRIAWRTKTWNYYIVGLRDLLPFSKHPEALPSRGGSRMSNGTDAQQMNDELEQQIDAFLDGLHSEGVRNWQPGARTKAKPYLKQVIQQERKKAAREALEEVKEPLMDLQGGRGNSHFENGVKTATNLIDEALKEYE